eukprot:1240560-Amphidinium_carterae.1
MPEQFCLQFVVASLRVLSRKPVMGPSGSWTAFRAKMPIALLCLTLDTTASWNSQTFAMRPSSRSVRKSVSDGHGECCCTEWFLAQNDACVHRNYETRLSRHAQ